MIDDPAFLPEFASDISIPIAAELLVIPSQLTFDIEAEKVTQCNIIDAQKISYSRTTAEVTDPERDHPGRMKLSAHLDRRKYYYRTI